jgi:PAS domain S-box-containing protein
MRNLWERRFAGVLEAAPDALVCVECDGRIALVNAQAERLFGYSKEQLLGQPLETLLPEDARKAHGRLRARYLANPQPRPMGARQDLVARHRDGSKFPAEISLAAVDTSEGTLVIAAVRDVTERLKVQAERDRLKTQAERDRLELRLQQSQRMESLGQLAGGVAHDFNNLLVVISNCAAFVADALGRPVTADTWDAARADVEQIQLAAERAAGLTRQLLAFARREAAQPRVLDLNQVVANVLQLLRRTLGEHVELVTGLDPDLDRVLADPGQVEQILVNLAVNARDAMSGGGTLSIHTANADVDQEYAGVASLSPGRYVALKVSDTGTGMPPEVISRAFEPFFTTKPKGQGTGLGLATIYGIVTQAGGSVQIYSEPGLGTAVTVMLPVATRPLPTSEQRPDVAEPGHGELVLVVDDDAAVRGVTQRMLAGHGYQVMVAASGHEAIEAATVSAGRIDALVTDVVMHGMQGPELARRIRELQPGISILYVSGYPEGLLDARGVLEQGLSFLEKPFTEASLLKKLCTLLRVRETRVRRGA